ncbi:amino acid ABC transporter permease [Tersicoccus sp. Bi-70]|uniref:amino acid ABC transporter permease n=1 Tax=Tersicoccus sp. Bi-70 TaxID=1897634 RepID=UPI000978ACA7|nr:amino acid ABC transporter permease [Tersicoccus sp. Bi-70]OMH34871.1 ABC transporter permease [Tersicoccus sp. Bi-70]
MSHGVTTRRDPDAGGNARPDLIRAVPVRHPWRWVGAAVLIVLVALLAQSLVTNENYRWDVVAKYLLDTRVIAGVGWTLLLTVLSMVIAIVLAITLALMRQSDNPLFRWVSWVWVWFFRGTPVYTQLVFWGLASTLYPNIALGVPFGPELFTIRTETLLSSFWAATLGLALNESAYLAEIFRAGLKSVDNGQEEAAEALGMRKSVIMRRIVLPQAMRVIVPPTGNETIGMLKTTSLVLAVPFILDLTFSTNAIANRIYLPIPLLIVAAFWYLLVTSILMVGQFYIERHFGRGVDADSPAPVKVTPAAHHTAADDAATTDAPALAGEGDLPGNRAAGGDGR